MCLKNYVFSFNCWKIKNLETSEVFFWSSRLVPLPLKPNLGSSDKFSQNRWGVQNWAKVDNIICARSLTKKFREGVCFFGYQYRFLKSTLCLPSITTTLELISWQNLLSKPNMTQLKPTQKQLRWVDIVARELKFGTDTHLISLIKERVQSDIKISQI